ncbi:hypothetical protein DH2020_012250 [Rehmannia glutinosa]|uniref:Ubiquitin-like domain-containing protein n=1 Tax=Rehmannia glutinosa TaxID=99300 RepID=A0ABR0X1B7_REHGL
MSGVQDQLEIKFRLTDGSDIGPKNFPVATSVATLKENIIAQWPREKENGPRTVKDIKLISGGRILENSKTVGECKSPLCDIPGVNHDHARRCSTTTNGKRLHSFSLLNLSKSTVNSPQNLIPIFAGKFRNPLL